MTTIAEVICPIIVAYAAPAIPILNPNIKTASKITFMTAPRMLQIIATLGLPSARIRCPPPTDKIKNGKPNDVILT